VTHNSNGKQLARFFQLCDCCRSHVSDNDSPSPYRLTLQDDGNLVLLNKDNVAAWSPKVTGGVRLQVQNDGNVVLYNFGGNAIWSTQTSNDNPTAGALAPTDAPGWDINVAADATAVPPCLEGWSWKHQFAEAATRAADSRRVGVIMQSGMSRNGELVSKNGRAKLILTEDGNLVVAGAYRTPWATIAEFSGTSRWASHTGLDTANGTKTERPYKLHLQNDGNMILKDKNGTVTWTSTRAKPEDIYVKVWSGEKPGVGDWGGVCTCPGGQTYEVGDNNDDCASLACIGGTGDGGCKQRSRSEAGASMRVTCQGHFPSNDWELKVQDDGNVVLYSPKGDAAWSTGTSWGNKFTWCIPDDPNSIMNAQCKAKSPFRYEFDKSCGYACPAPSASSLIQQAANVLGEKYSPRPENHSPELVAASKLA